MLVLSRRVGEGIYIGNTFVVKVADIQDDCVDLVFSFTSLSRFTLPECRLLPLDQEMVTRRKNEGVRIGNDIEILVIGFRPEGESSARVRIGINAPPETPIYRAESVKS